MSHSLCTHAVILTVFNLASTSPRFHHSFCLQARPPLSTSSSGASFSVSSSDLAASCSLSPEDGYPFLFEPSERAISFCWSRPTPHHPIFVSANCLLTFFSSSFVQTLPQENCWPLPFAPEFRCASPCTGEEGRCRNCRLSLQLHCGEQGLQGPQQPPCWRSISHCFEALL